MNLEETTKIEKPGMPNQIVPTDDPNSEGTQMDPNTASPLNIVPSIIPVVIVHTNQIKEYL